VTSSDVGPFAFGAHASIDWACKLHQAVREVALGEALMLTRSNPPVVQPPSDQSWADLEAQLVRAVADFGLDELTQMLDTAEAIRRVRRM
jgi:hypothetical protein